MSTEPSWIVETLLQLSATESAQVPDAWLEAVCSDLFRDHRSANKNAPESLHALGALLDATTRAKIGTDGFEFEVGKKDVKKALRQVQ